MLTIKKLDIYLLKKFLGTLVITTTICIFVLLMQFVWSHINDLVGKGVAFKIIFEFFVYAISGVLPLALPLAILLASLMTFGSIGENYELTAMKASGISLFYIMRPLIFACIFLSIGSFMFSNHVLPRTQVKLWTLIFSLRQTSPELDIPVGEFCFQISGYNLYVRHKNTRTGMLYDLMIYDYSGGFKNAKVMMADSGKILFTDDKKYIVLCLHNGESFENLNEQQQRATKATNNVPYRRESFVYKTILIDFNSDINMFDETGLKSQHIAKNAFQLRHSVDSVKNMMHAKENELGKNLISMNYLGREVIPNFNIDSIVSRPPQQNANVDSLFASLDNNKKIHALQLAIEKANAKRNIIQYNALVIKDNLFYIRKHLIEYHKKFTLALACLIFFFIGAPLGAIVKKGGIGFPLIISVFFFILYYVLDNIGYKMAKEFVVSVFEGAWLSSMILIVIGIWITYKATKDAELFHVNFWLSIYYKIKDAFLYIWRLVHIGRRRKA